jgi:hypothetical protein
MHTRSRVVARALVTVLVLAVLAVWSATPASSGGFGTLEVVKVVDGAQPPGSFVIEVRCDTAGVIPLTFDGPGTETVPLEPDTQDCEVVETDDLGALSVTYECQDVVAPVDPGDEGCQPPGPGGNFFQMFDSGQVVRVTITNTFAGGGPTSTTTSTTTSASNSTATSTTVVSGVTVSPTAAQPATAARANPQVVG